MFRFAAVFALFATTSVGMLYGQHAVDPARRYHRLICLVHLHGSGKAGDEIRPEYVPSDLTSRDGIIAWSMQQTDDGKMAIIQVVAVDRKAFAAIFADTRPEIRVFEIGKDDRNKIEAEMKKYKKDFDLDTMKLPVQ